VEYIEAIDHLLGLVGQDVLVRVGDREEHAGFVMLSGTLGQGEREPIFVPSEGPVSFFAVGSDSGSTGIYIYREDFTRATYSAETERLTIWLGPVAIIVERH
jgi:hypothetical protein